MSQQVGLPWILPAMAIILSISVIGCRLGPAAPVFLLYSALIVIFHLHWGDCIHAIKHHMSR